MMSKILSVYTRNFIFGVEDSLVSTLGFLSGIATAEIGQKNILITGVVLIFVEAFSMGVGSFLSENNASSKLSIRGGIIMFFSYFLTGFIPLFPYLLLDNSGATIFSIVLSLFSLFFLGALSAKPLNRNPLKHALKMLIVGGLAANIGMIAGTIIQ